VRDEAVLEHIALEFFFFVFHKPRNFQPMFEAALVPGVKGHQVRSAFRGYRLG
jgi:hypothetical protein